MTDEQSVMQPVEIMLARWKYAGLLAGSILFVCVGLYLLYAARTVQSEVYILLRVAGWACTGLFGFAALVYLSMLFRNPVLLKIDAEGIHDYASPFGGGTIRWGDISEIRCGYYLGQTQIGIRLTDASAYAAKQRGMKGWLTAVNRRFTGMSVLISGQAMSVPLQQVYDEMETRRKMRG